MELVDFLNSVLDEPVQTSNRNIISPKELDIVVPNKKVAIEFNGNRWHSELMGKDKNYHLNKTTECERLGLQLIHVFESEWVQQQQLVKSRLLSKLGLCESRIGARMLTLSEPTKAETRNFLNTNHIQGSSGSSVEYGLYDGTELVGVMTFVKSRFNKEIDWELARYCSKQNTTIMGGASKLFKHFIMVHCPASIISYSDRRWNTGELYTSLGFEFSHNSAPNYKYFKTGRVYDQFSRQSFQKHKLVDKLVTFDSALSEWENMKNNGYDRIWDCGNSVFVWHN
jgi:hypothetical protein